MTSSQGFFFPIWSISWYQWRRDVMTLGRHQCQFGSHRWCRVDIDVNSHQWRRVNIWATQMSTRHNWCEFKCQPNVTDVNQIDIDNVPASWHPGIIDITRLIKVPQNDLTGSLPINQDSLKSGSHKPEFDCLWYPDQNLSLGIRQDISIMYCP